jgi:hypothetical protein
LLVLLDFSLPGGLNDFMRQRLFFVRMSARATSPKPDAPSEADARAHVEAERSSAAIRLREM